MSRTTAGALFCDGIRLNRRLDGGGAIVCPGVGIGDQTVIGPGAWRPAMRAMVLPENSNGTFMITQSSSAGVRKPQRDFESLKQELHHWPAADLAGMLVEMPERDKVTIFRLFPNRLAADTFEYLTAGSQRELLMAIGKEQAAGILNEMSPDDRTACPEELPSAVVAQDC